MKKSIVSLGLALVTMFTVSAAEIKSAPTNHKHTLLITRITTPLCVAISKGDLETVKKFVEYGADVNEKSNGLTPLMIAATYNQHEIIRFLLSKGADPSIKTENGLTALKFAVQSKSTDALALLSESK